MNNFPKTQFLTKTFCSSLHVNRLIKLTDGQHLMQAFLVLDVYNFN